MSRSGQPLEKPPIHRIVLHVFMLGMIVLNVTTVYRPTAIFNALWGLLSVGFLVGIALWVRDHRRYEASVRAGAQMRHPKYPDAPDTA